MKQGAVRDTGPPFFFAPESNGQDWPVAKSHGPRTTRPTGTCA